MPNIDDLRKLKEQVEQVLGREILVDESQTPVEEERSLPIKVLSIFGGFLAGIFFTGFLFLTNLADPGASALFWGLAMYVLALVLSVRYTRPFQDSLSLSSYLIAYFLIGIGIMDLNATLLLTALTFMVMASIALFVVTNYLISFCSILIILGSLFFILVEYQLDVLIPLYVGLIALFLTHLFVRQAYWIAGQGRMHAKYSPMRVAFLLAFLLGLACLGGNVMFGMSILPHVWIASLSIFVAFVYLLQYGTRQYTFHFKELLRFLMLGALVFLPTFFAPAISGALLLIFLSFRVGYKVGVVLGVVGLLYFTSQYYYDLSFTLLTKSILMFCSGMVLVLMYILLTKTSVFDAKH